MENIREYVDSLENSGEKLTEADWRAWIEREQNDFAEQDERFSKLSENDIDTVIDTLSKDGFVK